MCVQHLIQGWRASLSPIIRPFLGKTYQLRPVVWDCARFITGALLLEHSSGMRPRDTCHHCIALHRIATNYFKASLTFAIPTRNFITVFIFMSIGLSQQYLSYNKFNTFIESEFFIKSYVEICYSDKPNKITQKHNFKIFLSIFTCKNNPERNHKRRNTFFLMLQFDLLLWYWLVKFIPIANNDFFEAANSFEYYEELKEIIIKFFVWTIKFIIL